ncbi:MAG: ATP-grasp domain-containing protein [Clostridia bacterium]
MKTTLVTAVGSSSAQTVCQQLHALGHRVIGCDIYPRAWNIASCAVDVFFQAEYAANADAYVRQLLDAVETYALDYLIPLTDVEVDVLCARKPQFQALGCTVCTPDEPVARLCRDKLAMAEQLCASAICTTIPTFSPYGRTPKSEDFPLLLKPLHGRSSQGLVVTHTPAAFAAALATREDYIAQPYLQGDVWTVDVAMDRFGHVQTLARKELLRTVTGLGTTVCISPSHALDTICAAIAAHAGIIGAVNMEFIEHEGQFYFLEVNPRFSGGLGFSLAGGVDFTALHIACHAGESIGARGKAKAVILTRRIEAVVTQSEE